MLVTPESLANEIRLTRSQRPGPFALAEGGLDGRIYRRVLSSDATLLVARGRENALGALRLLEDEGAKDSCAIIDSDFRRLTGTPDLGENVHFTDHHDAECMVLNSPAFDKVIEIYARPTKVASWSGTHDLRTKLLEVALPLGALRYVSDRDGLRLRFEELNLGRFIERRTLTVDVEQMVKTALSNSRRNDLDGSQLVEEVDKVVRARYDPWQLVCGHDVVEVLSIGLTAALGSQKAIDVRAEQLSRALELAYESAWFSGSRLEARMRRWEQSRGLLLLR